MSRTRTPTHTHRRAERLPMPPRCPVTGKPSYSDLLIAIRYALKFSGMYGHANRIYECGYCPHMHLTTRTPWSRPAGQPMGRDNSGRHACKLAGLPA